EELQRSAAENARAFQNMTFFAKLLALVHAAQYLTFAAFLLGLARSLEEPTAAASCLNLIRLSAILIAVQAMWQVISRVLLGSGAFTLIRVIGIAAKMISLLTLAQTVWYFLVLLEVRGLVGKRARPRVRRKGSGPRPTGG